MLDLTARFRRLRHSLPRLIESDDPGPAAPPVVEVVIPCIRRDLVSLPETIRGVKTHLRHPIARIRLISPDDAGLRDFARKEDLAWTNEEEFRPPNLGLKSYVAAGRDRTGWLLQQFIKLQAEKMTEEAYFVIDADTILNRPIRFQQDGRTVFLESDEFHTPYRKMYFLLFGREPTGKRSFVAHQMFFERDRVLEMRREIEARSGRPWHETILKNLSADPTLSFSEFETYANWHLEKYSRGTTTKNWGNVALTLSEYQSPKWLNRLRLPYYWSISVHAYLESENTVAPASSDSNRL